MVFTDARVYKIADLVADLLDLPVSAIFLTNSSQYVHSARGRSEQQRVLDVHLAGCSRTLVPPTDDVVVLDVLAADERFVGHPCVMSTPPILFFVSAPLLSSNGTRFGTLCAMDYKARRWGPACSSLMTHLAQLLSLLHTQQPEPSQDAPGPSSNVQNPHQDRRCKAVALLDGSVEGWDILYCTQEWAHALGADDAADFEGCKFWNELKAVVGQQLDDHALVLDSHVKGQESFELFVRRLMSSSSQPPVRVELRPATRPWTTSVTGSVTPGLGTSTMLGLSTAIPHPSSAPSSSCPTSHPCPAPPPPGGEALNPGLYLALMDDGFGLISSCASSPGSKDKDATSTVSVPDQVPGLKVKEVLGVGAYATVYKGDWQGQAVAVKEIKQRHQGISANHWKRMEEGLEGLIGLNIHHPGLVSTLRFEVATEPIQKSTRKRRHAELSPSSQPTPPGDEVYHQAWLIMEYCDGGTLREAIKSGKFRKGSCPSAESDMASILYVCTSIADAMAHLHSNAVIHGDLTPRNIMLASSPDAAQGYTLKVCDFGLSHLNHDASTITTDTCGTITHMPRELVVSGELRVSCDVYAYGVIMWELFTGQQPWAGRSVVQIIALKMQGRAVLQFPQDTPAEYKELAVECMSSDIGQRPPFTDVLSRLQAIKQLHPHP